MIRWAWLSSSKTLATVIAFCAHSTCTSAAAAAANTCMPCVSLLAGPPLLCPNNLAAATAGCRAEKEALSNELNDLREMMAAEAHSRAALQDALAAAERQLGEARNELDMTKTVSTQCI